MKKLRDTDRIQTWAFTTRVAPGHEWGDINTRTVETVDFDAGIVTTHTTGTHEGERVDRKDSFYVAEGATPERSAAFRRRNGATRIK